MIYLRENRQLRSWKLNWRIGRGNSRSEAAMIQVTTGPPTISSGINHSYDHRQEFDNNGASCARVHIAQLVSTAIKFCYRIQKWNQSAHCPAYHSTWFPETFDSKVHQKWTHCNFSPPSYNSLVYNEQIFCGSPPKCFTSYHPLNLVLPIRFGFIEVYGIGSGFRNSGGDSVSMLGTVWEDFNYASFP